MPAYIKALCIFLCTALAFALFPCPISAYSIIPSVSAHGAILIDASSGKILFEKNATLRLPMASTTKIMTALVALEYGDLQKTVSVDSRAVGTEGSSVYLENGEKITLGDLLYCLMLASANDAASAIAYAIAGGNEQFAALMNKKAAELGLFDTSFKNPHGLDADGHYTTAEDLALLSAHALSDPEFLKIVSTNSAKIKTDREERTLFNHNRLLRNYDGCIGVKTGFTKKSGRCLVSAAERGGLRLVCVTLGAPDDWNDHKNLLDYGFSRFQALELCKKGQKFHELPVVSGEPGRVFAVATENITLTVPKGDTDFRAVIYCDRFLWKRPANGERIGRVIFYKNGKIISETPLAAHILY